MRPVSQTSEAGEDDAGPAPQSGLLGRVRNLVSTLDLDCECRGKLDTALQRFETLESRRQLRRLILDAQQQAERIAALLDFVGELDAIGTEETDISVFEEIALLFDDMKEAAARGAEDMRRTGDFRIRRNDGTTVPAQT